MAKYLYGEISLRVTRPNLIYLKQKLLCNKTIDCFFFCVDTDLTCLADLSRI